MVGALASDSFSVGLLRVRLPSYMPLILILAIILQHGCRFVTSRPTDFMGVLLDHVPHDFDESDSDDDDELDEETRAEAAIVVKTHLRTLAAKREFEPGFWNANAVCFWCSPGWFFLSLD